MSDRISAYVEKRLFNRLGLPAGPFTLERCQAGVHSEVYFLALSGWDPLVLKVFSRRPRFRSAVAGLQYLAELGIAAPRLVAADEDSRFFNRRGMHVLCEERIMGESLEHVPRTPELIAAAAGLFAGMHSHTSDAWGDIAAGRRSGLFAYLRKKTLERLNGWGCAEELSPGLRGKILEKLDRGEPAVSSLSCFSLSHSDPNRNNILQRESDRKLFLLDTGSLRYLPRGIDYFMLQAYLCLNSPEHAALFEKIYFQNMAAREINAFRDTQDFFKLYVIILFAHDLATRGAALAPGSPYKEEFTALAALAKKALGELIDAT